MKKNTIVLFALLSLTIASCRKLYDQYTPNPKIAANLCRISQMKVYDDGRSGTYTLHYDQKGNLTSMILDSFITGVHYSYFLQYDSKNRLIHFQEFPPGFVGAEDVYVYFPDKIVDTTYFYGRIEKRYAELKTDVHGRIIKETSFNPQSFTDTTIVFSDTVYYQYGKDNNLVVQPPILPPIYDNKVNPYVTNAVWQLLCRDYSVNNATDNFFWTSQFPDIVKYNAYGLPLKFVRPSYSHHKLFMFRFECDSLELTYDCDVPKKGY